MTVNMKKSIRVIILTILVGLLASMSISAVSAAALKNTQTTIMLNGNAFVPGSPIKTSDGNIMVPLKAIVKQLGLEMSWNTEYRGYRINGFHKVVLIKPNSKLTKSVEINSNNYNPGYWGRSFKTKTERMPAPLSDQGGIHYISLKWLANQFGLTLSIQGDVIHVGGRMEPYSVDHVKEVYEALGNKGLMVGSGLSDFSQFLSYAYNKNLNSEFETINRPEILAMLGKTYWLYDRYNVAVAQTNQGVTLSRFSEIKIIDEYSYEESIVLHKNTLYRINNYFIQNVINYDPQKMYKWSPKVWENIKKYTVHVGMTRKQVELAWGQPKRINDGGILEQWVYPDYNYLYFRDGLLAYIN